MVFQFTSWHLTLDGIERSNQGHLVFIGLYIILSVLLDSGAVRPRNLLLMYLVSSGFSFNPTSSSSSSTQFSQEWVCRKVVIKLSIKSKIKWTEVHVKGYPWRIWLVMDAPPPACHAMLLGRTCRVVRYLAINYPPTPWHKRVKQTGVLGLGPTTNNPVDVIFVCFSFMPTSSSSIILIDPV